MDTNYLAAQVTSIIKELHGLFDEIGIPGHERESREADVSYNLRVDMSQSNKMEQLLSALSETLHGRLKLVNV